MLDFPEPCALSKRRRGDRGLAEQEIVSGLYSIPEQRWTDTRSTERPRDAYADGNQPSRLDDTSPRFIEGERMPNSTPSARENSILITIGIAMSKSLGGAGPRPELLGIAGLYGRRSRRRVVWLFRRSSESPISHNIGGQRPTNSARRSAFPRSL